jgi:hypothetical protein
MFKHHVLLIHNVTHIILSIKTLIHIKLPHYLLHALAHHILLVLIQIL